MFLWCLAPRGMTSWTTNQIPGRQTGATFETFLEFKLKMRSPQVYDEFTLAHHGSGFRVHCVSEGEDLNCEKNSLRGRMQKNPQIIGPRLMANRKPFNVRTLQLWYNIIHLAINIFLFREAAMTGWLTGDNSYRCQPVDFSNTGVPYRVALKHLQLNEIKTRFPIDRLRKLAGSIISANSRTSSRRLRTFWWRDSTWSICTT